MTQHILIIANGAPYGSESLFNALRLGIALNEQEGIDLKLFLMSDAVGFINGEVVTIDGGEWLQGAGQFNFVGDHMSDADWQALRTKK